MRKETVNAFFVIQHIRKKLLAKRIYRLGWIWVQANGGAYPRYKATYWLKYRLEEAADYANRKRS